jgi:tRNA nucleotidyltransferase (CCA-adding enzyme)
MNIKLYRVGGFVRDELLGVRSKDLDFAVEAPSYEAMVEWVRSQGEIYLESPQFWTVRAHIKGKLPADFVLCRKDGQYSDGRRPDSVSVGTLHDDLSRRDFTMNAIAVCEQTGEFIDPFNGRIDLDNRLIRCVGKAHDRFFEDSLRLLRAIRFKIVKGFNLHEDIVQCLGNEELADRLANVSDERKREELHKCLANDTPATLALLGQFSLISKAVFGSKKLWLMPTMKDA